MEFYLRNPSKDTIFKAIKKEDTLILLKDIFFIKIGSRLWTRNIDDVTQIVGEFRKDKSDISYFFYKIFYPYNPYRDYRVFCMCRKTKYVIN